METTRLTLRLPPELASQAADVAAQQGLTMNAFIVQAVRNWVTYQGKRLGSTGLPSTGPVRSSARAITAPPVQTVPKVGANDPCPCGSGQKYKRCHGRP
ncbi:YlcI/YnfO family protein [Rhodanobacter ginsengisoli]|uniref:YlcI/YnfO family protein n=1 Tax=Rhodanobacter ginsengisoli TaxID=418646 RepID=A0ABW0QLI4_9GAMM